MFLDAYKVQDFQPEMVPGSIRRDWMDEIYGRHAYRCLPLNMANVTGWELKLAYGFDATWHGVNEASDLTLTPHEADAPMEHIASSHFAFGILTFHTGYIFRTPENWATWVMAPPNSVKDGIDALSGLVETDWLPYPFTMNWKFTRPGTVRFEKGESFCFITLTQPQALEDIQPRILDMESNPDLHAQYEEWAAARSDFNSRIEAKDPDAIREAWQKYYMKGQRPSGCEAEVAHTNRRRLGVPKAMEYKKP